MILPFPYKPEDWLLIWQSTRTMTLKTSDGKQFSFSIERATAVEIDDEGHLDAVKVTVADGYFHICFGEPSEVLSSELVFQIDCRDPKKGRWKIPKSFLDRRPDSTKDEH